MNLPSEKRLEEAFPNKGKVLRTLLSSDYRVNQHEAVIEWKRTCFNSPSMLELRMCALNAELEGHGVEAVFAPGEFRTPDMQYVNMGDAYVTTIIFDHFTQTFKIQEWGTWLEIAERKGKKYA